MNSVVTGYPAIVPPFRPLPAALMGGGEVPFAPSESVMLSPAAQQAAAEDRRNPAEVAAQGVNTGLDAVDSAATGGNRVLNAAATAGDDAARGVSTATKGLTTLGKVGKVAGPVGLGLTAVTTGAEVIGALRDPNLNKEEKAEKVGGAVGGGLGGIGGGLGGVAAGAAIGAAGGPPGIVIGALIGGVAGGLGGDKVGSFIGEKLGKLFG